MPSFSYRIKSEICSNRPFRQRHKRALAYGLLLFGKEFGLESVAIHTENRSVARLYANSISDLVGLGGSITVREVKRKERPSVYIATVDSLADREAILSYFGYGAGTGCCQIRPALLPEEEISAFVSGAFLAAGSVSDPEKSYRAEFATPHKTLCEGLGQILSEQLGPPKETTRRNDYLLYYKESEHMEDLLTYIGAPKAALELMEVKIMKGVRNKVNRETNCETANISKTIDAAMSQIEAIRYIDAHGGLDQLPEELRELARLRMGNPDLSLRELMEALDGAISRSGVNHRLKRISDFAQDLRQLL